MGSDQEHTTRDLDPVRLQKALADAGIAARRECEEMIREGRVQVNGRVVDVLPAFVDPRTDVVEVDGRAVDLRGGVQRATAARRSQTLCLLLHKPRGVITTTHDPEGRPNVMSLVPRAIAATERLFPVGRLDADSTGLLLLTNDGELAHRLAHPSYEVTKEYRVLVRGLASEAALARLRKGMHLAARDGKRGTGAHRASMDSVRIVKRYVDRHRGDRTLLSITLREGKNREIRRVLARVGLRVCELERVAIGPLRAPQLKPGETKLLGRREIERLRAATFR